MTFEEQKKETAPQAQESSETDEMRLQRELLVLGIEASPENIKCVAEQMRTPQLPAGYDEITNNLNNPEALKSAMETKGVKSIVHAEGRTLWDHSRTALEQIDLLDISDEQKADLKLIMLYHDLGKTEVWNNAQNQEATKKKLAKGELHQSMIGHDKAQLDGVRAGFSANGIEGAKLTLFMKVVENHMQTNLVEQDVKKTVVTIESLGGDDAGRRKAVELLALVLQLDGDATEHIELANGELKYSKNEKKTEITADMIWDKYKEGKEKIAAEATKKKETESAAAFEMQVFGKKLSEYLMKDRGKKGKEMKDASERVKKIIQENQSLPPEEIKKLVDAAEL